MKKRWFWLAISALIAVLLISGTVFADGEEPAVTPTEEPSIIAATDEPIIELSDETPMAEESQAELLVGEVVLADDLTAIVEAAPADTSLAANVITTTVEDKEDKAEPILADASGEPLVLASQESADLIGIGDPYWFVGSQKYAVVFNLADCPTGTTAGLTCWQSGTPITAALTHIETGLLPTNRKLYIIGGTTYIENIAIDATSVVDYYKGQLNGFLGVADSLGNYPILSGNILLEGLKNGFTLSDFTITGYLSIQDSKGAVVVKNAEISSAAGSGIMVGDETGGVYNRHIGNVTLNNVTSNGNAGTGAEIYTEGVTTITNSAFNFNGAEGLNMNTITGKIWLKDITAIGNQDDNVLITKYQNSLTIRNAVLNDSQSSNGLYAVSTTSAPVTLDAVIANNNDLDGIYLKTNGMMMVSNLEASGSANGTGMYLNHTLGLSPVQVAKSQFMNNGLSSSGYGLMIYSKGDILLTSISAGGNKNNGLFVNNCLESFGECLGSGNVTLTSPISGGLLSANYFVNNGGGGIEVYSEGIVTLSNFASDDNGDYGLYIDNHLARNGITLNSTLPYWSNTANNNTFNGIDLWSRGFVNVANTSASDNGSIGFNTGTNPSFVLIADGEFNNNSSGLIITSYNPITIDNVDANDNTNHGMYLEVNAAKTVGVIKSSAINNANGIFVSTKGSTVFVTVEATDNTGYGAAVEGCIAGTCSADANFVMYGNNFFNGNGGIGLDVNTNGGISISNVSADSNGSQGLRLDNTFADLTSGVTIINNASHFLTGNSIGLEVYTYGAITLTQVSSSGNTSFGAWLDNSGAATAKALTLQDCTFENNSAAGIYADIYGPIYAYGLRASENTGSGADLNNTNGGVTINSSGRGLSRFIDNGTTGLDINSTGAVALSNIAAELNASDGVTSEHRWQCIHKWKPRDSRHFLFGKWRQWPGNPCERDHHGQQHDPGKWQRFEWHLSLQPGCCKRQKDRSRIHGNEWQWKPWFMDSGQQYREPG